MSDWPKYEPNKAVRAAKIVAINDDLGEGENFFWVDPGTGALEKFVPPGGIFSMVKVDDYAIVYRDGRKSVSPAKAFEDGYTRVEG